MNALKIIIVITTILYLSKIECSPERRRHSDSFQITTVPNEFIVQFYGKYFADIRKNYLQTKLSSLNISNWAWTVVTRQNFGTSFPSDFDIVRIVVEQATSTASILQAIESHPAVKAVVPQRSARRLLTSYDNATCTYHIRQPHGAVRNKKPSRARQVTSKLHADVLWNLGITGKGIKVAIFDTGLTKNHPHFRNVKERTNWTNEKSLDDGVGLSHGTFVAGVIASSEECLGFAPDAELHIYKVFTKSQVSYTSWFLDAFNYAIYRKVNILNLSIGGPDFMDSPFVEKVLELSANNIIMISSAGNDGPLYGTLNNPGDQGDVIGVGGINFENKIARFSSRGMTTWELPFGYGRLGLDIVTYGSQVEGSDVHKGCRRLSGTSVSSPVVAGAAALLLSGAMHKMHLINPASLKQILIEGAEKLPNYNMFEQGQGKLCLLKSMQVLLSYKPKISLIPASLDFTSNYMWPYSSQPLYYGSSVVIVNVTILNGISLTSRIVDSPKWIPDINNFGQYLNISTATPRILWPWTGWMTVYIAINKNGENHEGISKGNVSLLIESILLGTNETHLSEVNFPLTIKVTPKPPRNKRVLWDQYHSLRYPPGYIPRDDLKIKTDPLDWRADHIHTNFRDLYIHLRNVGYYIDVLREPYTCFNASEYGTLLIIDPEEEFFNEEISTLESYVYDNGLSVIVFADWYNITVMKKIRFFDENTRQWWIPDTGGANIPAVNDLLHPFGIALGDFVGEGHFKLGDHSMYYASGTTMIKIPHNPDDIVVGANLNDQGASIITNSKAATKESKVFLPILGLFQTKSEDRQRNKPDMASNLIAEKTYGVKVKSNASDSNSAGRIAIYGDSNCLDSTHLEKACYWLLLTFLDFTMNSHISGLLKTLNHKPDLKDKDQLDLPVRIPGSNLEKFSKVLNAKSNGLTQKCEHFEWLRAASDADYHKHVPVSTWTTSDTNEHQNNLIKEIAKTLDNQKYNNNTNLNIKTTIIFLISLSLIIIVLFVIFVKKYYVSSNFGNKSIN
ncbi:uncharacterized protein Dwil_GK20275 [Drosophila willistoni]|uniref:Membrane-bound transcription factor site-1 protease n=1 Tax=Drosophila willistoni TaxID=7260 RepID=B4MXN4_DROWI|nr:membrane-bound transcription factor site-1 protease [Drosophila willistoni]EDW76803.2 uncharacterized protein Dwil_GK20275 [Drosophila willistoni]